MERVPKQVLSWFCSYALELDCDAGLIAFDGSQNFRHQVYANYKAGRAGATGMGAKLVEDGPFEGRTHHEAVYASLKPTKELFRSLGFKVLHPKTFEADDVLVGAAYKLSKLGHHVYLDTNDKDMVQAVSKNVSIYHAEMTNRPREILTPANLPAMKFGLSPKQFLDYQTLMGDEVDGIPCVSAMTKSTALEILREHGSLEKFFATKKGDYFYRLRRTELHRNRKLVRMDKDAFTCSLEEMLFKNLKGEVAVKAFTVLRDQQRKGSLFG